MDGDAVKRASDAAMFAANMTRVLSGLEMALARQDEDNGSMLEEDAWEVCPRSMFNPYAAAVSLSS